MLMRFLKFKKANNEALKPKKHQSDAILNLFKRQQAQTQAIQSIFESTQSEIKLTNANSQSLQKKSLELRQLQKESEQLASEIIQNLESLKNLTNQVQATRSQVETVMKFLTQIDDVAEQTNILSINAAIEAARAGEFGRAFGVVSNQIGELAHTSANMAKEIRNQLNQLQSRTQQFEEEFGHFLNHIHQCGSKITHQAHFIQSFSDSTQAEISNIIHSTESLNAKIQARQVEVKLDLENLTKMVSDIIGELTSSHITDLDCSQAYKILDQLRVIDVRRVEEFCDELGHIPNATLSTLDRDLEAYLDSQDPQLTYLFVCRSGGRSARAARIAQAKGFSHIYNLKGGMLEWNRLGLPTVR